MLPFKLNEEISIMLPYFCDERLSKELYNYWFKNSKIPVQKWHSVLKDQFKVSPSVIEKILEMS